MKTFRKSAVPLTTTQVKDWLIELRGNPYVPESQFDVTTIFRARIGGVGTYYFAGVNVENQCHRLSTHGEEGSISAMATALGSNAEIVEGWVMGAPRALRVGDDHVLANNCVSCCGKCRQQIAGWADPAVKIHSMSLNGAQEETTVGALLPNAFTIGQLVADTYEHQDSSGLPPSASEVEARLIRNQDVLSKDEARQWLRELQSVDFISNRSSTAILKLENCCYVAGVQIEDPAFVSIDSIQAAIAIANAEFGAQRVLEVFAFSQHRDAARNLPSAYVPLSGAAVQVLSEFVASRDVLVHFFNSTDENKTISLSEASRYTPTFALPTGGLDT